jgi:hypothetical protein
MATTSGDPVHLEYHDGEDSSEQPSWPPRPVIKPGTVFVKAPSPVKTKTMSLAMGDDMSHVCEFVEGLAPRRGHKTSAIWGYFSHLDLEVHPDMKTWRLCKVCRRNGVDKALNVTENSSTGSLIEHLKRMHPDEYQMFLKEKEEKLVAKAANEGVVTSKAPPGSKGSNFSGRKRKSSLIKLEGGATMQMPVIQVAGAGNAEAPKSLAERFQEELLRLVQVQKLAEERLDTISTRLEQGRVNMSPFDVALLQDRKESAVKNVQAIAKKVDSLFDKFNKE